MTAWNDFVTKIYNEEHKKNPDYMFKQADSVDSAVKAILQYEQQDLTEPIAQLAIKLHNNFFSATKLINTLKDYDERK